MVPRRVALDIGAVDPSAALEAVTRATTDDPGLHVVLVGDGVEHLDPADGVSVQPARSPGRDLDPAVAVRGQADLSIRVALELGRDGDVDAVMSASPLSAVLTAVRFLLRRRVGVRDPLLAVTLHTDADDVVLLDASGRDGPSPGSLVAAAEDLGALPATVGLLDPGAGDSRAAGLLAQTAGVDVQRVGAATALAGTMPIVFADGAAGSMLVDAVAALAPRRLGTHRVVGLQDAPAVYALGDDVASWSQRGLGRQQEAS